MDFNTEAFEQAFKNGYLEGVQEVKEALLDVAALLEDYTYANENEDKCFVLCDYEELLEKFLDICKKHGVKVKEQKE